MSQLIEILLLINIFSFTFDRYPMKLIIIHYEYHFQSKAMRVMQTHFMDLFTIMECHFQRSIRKAIKRAVIVQVSFNPGESEYQSSCAYHYSFLFSGWWFGGCTYVALNGKYNFGFLWYSPVTNYYIHPNHSEMKIRRK